MRGPPAIPCAKCGWFHRRTPEDIKAAREAVQAAKREERRKKQQYSMRRHDGGYRWSMFKRQARTRGIEVTLDKISYLKLISRPCFYCGSKERVGVDRVRSDGAYTPDNVVSCCATCNFMKGRMTLRGFVEQAEQISLGMGRLTRTMSSPI